MLTPFLYVSICLIWGSTWLAIKIGLEGVPPFLGAGLRFLMACAVLWVCVLARGRKIHLTRDDRISIASCGFISFALSYACVYWSEQYISSGLTAVLFSTTPLSVALLSHWTGAEPLTPRAVTGILVAVAGTALLFLPEGGFSGAPVAMFVAWCGSLASAVNLVQTRKHSRNTDVYFLNAAGMTIGAACLLAVSALIEPWSLVHWTRPNVLALAYLSLIGSVAAFLAFYHLVKTMAATSLSLVTLIIPIIAVVLGRALLGEALTPKGLAGMAIILSGVAVAALPWPRRGKKGLAPASAAVLLLCALGSGADAAQWRVRARETFDTGSFRLGDGREEVALKGFSSCFDLFYEEPFKYGYGLTAQRGALSRIGPAEGFTHTILGAEAKYFPTEKAKLWFARGGLLAEAIDPAGPPKDFWNYGFSAGTGLEFPVWKLGLAPEVGGKFLWGSRGRRTTTLYISLGVHFYAFPGDPDSP